MTFVLKTMVGINIHNTLYNYIILLSFFLFNVKVYKSYYIITHKSFENYLFRDSLKIYYNVTV